MLLVTQNSAKAFNIYFGVSGLTVTATLSKNGGSFNSVSPTITDRSNGYYSITPLAAHRDTIGENAWLFSASGQPSLPRVEQVGLANVDAVAVGANTVAPDNAGIAANGAAIAGLPDEEAIQAAVAETLEDAGIITREDIIEGIAY